MKSPKFDQQTDAGIEQAIARCGQGLGIVYQPRKFRRNFVRATGADRVIERSQGRGLPGMIGTVQPIKFLQYRSGRMTRLVFRFAPDQHLNTRAKYVGFTRQQRFVAAAGQRQY